MSFNSVPFFLFFVLVYVIYLAVDRPRQNAVLLAASYYFYATWDWRFLALISLSILTDYHCALRMEATPSTVIRRRYLLVSLVVNLGILGLFKYANFFVDNALRMASWIGLETHGKWLTLVLPVGISFYTFKTLSYTIDVYRRQVKACQSLLDYALYVSFFPQIISGPIDRAKNLLPQFAAPRKITAEVFRDGFFMVFLGLFKKLFLAENLSLLANGLLAAGDKQSGASILGGLYALAFQIYCDFSGYTDIARGLASLLGFRTMENFKMPFLSENLQDFWNRWHISLTSWIRDYLYYPLALSRIGGVKIDVRWLPIVTFAIMGLWHGASWNFIAWGLYHGGLITLYMLLLPRLGRYHAKGKKPASAIWKVIKPLAVFNIFAIGGAFFSARSLGESLTMLQTLFLDFRPGADALNLSAKSLLYIVPLLLAELVQRRHGELAVFLKGPLLFRYALISVMFYLLAIHGSGASNFVYMQF